MNRRTILNRLVTSKPLASTVTKFIIGLGIVLLSATATSTSVIGATAQTLPDPACRTVVEPHSETLICPLSVPLPPTVRAHIRKPIAPVPARNEPATNSTGPAAGNSVSPDISSSVADYYCNFGETCYASAEMSLGTVTITWYGYNVDTGNISVVSNYEAQCTVPDGCWFQSYWMPPNDNWQGTSVDMASDGYVELISCWCQDGSNSCTIY